MPWDVNMAGMVMTTPPKECQLAYNRNMKLAPATRSAQAMANGPLLTLCTEATNMFEVEDNIKIC